MDVIVTKHAIQQHQMRVISGRDEEDKQRLHVRRGNLVQDTIRAFARPTFDISKVLKVTFIPEGSVDDGGPRREFFQLAVKECMKTSSLFTGWPENVVPQHNVEAVANNTYYIVGKLISTCIIQGGQPPLCFSKAVADFLIYNEVRSEACLDDIEDRNVRDKLRQVIFGNVQGHLYEHKNLCTYHDDSCIITQAYIMQCQTSKVCMNIFFQVLAASSLECFKRIVDTELDCRFYYGYTKPCTQFQMSDREMLVKAIWLRFVFFSLMPNLYNLRKACVKPYRWRS